MERAELKSEIVKLLDACGVEHPNGHQDNYCGRYHVGNHINGPLTVVFEKGFNSKTGQPTPPNIWCPIKVEAYVVGINGSYKMAADLKINEHGKVAGRHSGLLSTPEFQNADLVKFVPKTLDEAKRVIEGIKKAAAVGIT